MFGFSLLLLVLCNSVEEIARAEKHSKAIIIRIDYTILRCGVVVVVFISDCLAHACYALPYTFFRETKAQVLAIIAKYYSFVLFM